MGMMDKLAGLMRGNEDLEDDYYDEEDDYVESPEPSKLEEENRFRVVEKKPATPPVKRRMTMSDASVKVYKPTAFEDARQIVETLLANNTVLLNFEGIDISISQRVLDIVTGACIAVNGNLQKISNYMFIATPSTVEVSGEFQDTLIGSFDSE